MPTRSLIFPSSAALSLLILVGCHAAVDGGGAGGDGGGGGSAGNGGSGGTSDGPCTKYTGPCQPGDTFECSPPPESVYGTCMIGPHCTTTFWCSTPLVLSFDGGPVELRAGSEATFDLDGSQSIVTDWPTARTPWLALDRDGDGRIGSGAELFGSMSPLPEGGRAVNGFEALRALDENGDGRIDARDPGFARLLLWSDADGDRASSPGELSPASASLVSIELSYRSEPRCDVRGNCEIERASFRFRDAAGVERAGEVIDVHLRVQSASAAVR